MAPELPEVTDRSAEAREALHRHLAATYGADHPEDAVALERVVDLTWRLRGIQSAMTHLEAQAQVLAQEDADLTLAGTLLDPYGAARPAAVDSRNLNVIEEARYAIGQLWGRLEEGTVPPWEDAQMALAKALGHARVWREDGDYGRLSFLLRVHANLPTQELKDTAQASCAELAGRLHEELAERLHAARAHLIALADAVEGASSAAPDPRYDHLVKRLVVVGGELDRATEALRRAVGQRRLRAIAGEWLGR